MTELNRELSSQLADQALETPSPDIVTLGGSQFNICILGGCDIVHSSHLPEGRSRNALQSGELSRCSPMLVGAGWRELRAGTRHLQ